MNISISSINSCAYCIHLKEKKKDGWKTCCDAFPDGIPHNLLFEKDNVTTLKECANGIKYKPNVEKQQQVSEIYDRFKG